MKIHAVAGSVERRQFDPDKSSCTLDSQGSTCYLSDGNNLWPLTLYLSYIVMPKNCSVKELTFMSKCACMCVHVCTFPNIMQFYSFTVGMYNFT